jgi:diguanylate cyclase (GGDEF)-like protein
VAELIAFPEEEQGVLSAFLEKLQVTPYWSGKNPRGAKASIRVVRLSGGRLEDWSVKKGLPLILIADPHYEIQTKLLHPLIKDLVWFGAWTADTFALARRIASMAHRLLEKPPTRTGPKPAELKCDRNGKVLHMSLSSASRMGGTPADFLGKQWLSWLEKTRRQVIQSWLREGISPHGRGLSDCLVRLPQGRWSFWDIWLQPWERGFSVQLMDESEKKELVDQLEYTLTHDPLTGFLNRWELRRRMEQHSQTGGGILMILDLDDFKIFNDTHGHDEGDKMLCRVARQLREHFGPDSGLARLGGDEFSVFLKNTRMDQAVRRARSLVSLMARQRARNGSSSEPSISVAMVKMSQGDTPSQLFHAADGGLRRAKMYGKARLEVVKEMRINPPSVRASWTLEVSQALQAGQFELWLQPVRELKEGEIMFHETLFRLWTPAGLVSPESALPAVERLGMRIQLASMVMHRCLELLKMNPRLRLSANIGREILSDADLAHDLVSSTRRAKIDPRRLILEISEETGLSELRAGKLLAQKLDRSGFCFCLDDYGRGAASLMEVIDLPIRMVKFDPRLWRQAQRPSRAQKVVTQMVRLFHDLEIQVIAVGVVDRKDLGHIRAMGISHAQGFELGKPRPTQNVLPPKSPMGPVFPPRRPQLSETMSGRRNGFTEKYGKGSRAK